MKKKIYLLSFIPLLVAGCADTTTPIFSSEAFTLYPDRVIQGEYMARASSATEVTTNYTLPNEAQGEKTWKLTADLSRYPRYTSNQVLVDALYNMALEETNKDIEADSTFRTGALWDGVWTRDISYSIYLSQVLINPQVAQNSLMRKVKNNRIIQDTGTGGSWPVSTDRIIWATAAWELYKINGSANWLKQSFEIIRNTVEDDRKVAFNPNTGLLYGESSFLDWREQEYPAWMEPVDIYLSQCLGTNVTHYNAYRILEQMASLLKEDPAPYTLMAESLKTAINTRLWLAEQKYYAQFLYGNTSFIVSPRCETLGESLAVLAGVANEERAKEVVSNTIVTPYGTPCFAPQLPGVPPYHNNAIWPFVQAYWSLAAAKTGNEEALTHSIAAIYRPAALYLTNWENLVAENGNHQGTELNSHTMLWSISGNLAMVYRVYMGMHFEADGIRFAPHVPASLPGEKKLENITYRHATLDLTLSGTGNHIKRFTINGKETDTPFFPASLIGKHEITIELDNQKPAVQAINLRPVEFSLPAPVWTVEGSTLTLTPQSEAVKYYIYRNGEWWMETFSTPIKLPLSDSCQEFMITALDKNGYESFSEKPYVLPANGFQTVPMHNIEISREQHTRLPFSIHVKESGLYYIDLCYANSSGPINTNNCCAIRTLTQESIPLGTFVMPQRGENAWDTFGYSTYCHVPLKAGINQFSIDLLPQNENMNGEVNTARINEIRIYK